MKTYKQVLININELKGYENNSRVHSDTQINQIANSIKKYGFTNPILITENKTIIAGHGRLEAVEMLNRFDYKDTPINEIPCIMISGLSQNDYKALVIADNKIALNASWDLDILKDELESLENENYDIDLLGFSTDEINDLLSSYIIDNDDYLKENDSEWDNSMPNGSLSDRYIEPPFSVINLRSQKSIDMANKWRDMGIKVGGRGENNGTFSALNSLMKKTSGESRANAINESIFNPYLCEILHHWFNIEKGGYVLGPFAGGMERGFVACSLGHKYIGFDVREEQVLFNRDNCNLLSPPNWILDSSENLLNYVDENSQDFILTCPPYADLEVYSDNPLDISNKSYDEFLTIYKDIIKKCFVALKNNRFAVWVVGEVRGSGGDYYNFIGDTISSFLDAGFKYYNEAIMLTPIGTGGLRANRSFKTRKLIKCHQNVLVFYKGDIKNIKAEFKDYSIDITGD